MMICASPMEKNTNTQPRASSERKTKCTLPSGNSGHLFYLRALEYSLTFIDEVRFVV